MATPATGASSDKNGYALCERLKGISSLMDLLYRYLICELENCTPRYDIYDVSLIPCALWT